MLRETKTPTAAQEKITDFWIPQLERLTGNYAALITQPDQALLINQQLDYYLQRFFQVKTPRLVLGGSNIYDYEQYNLNPRTIILENAATHYHSQMIVSNYNHKTAKAKNDSCMLYFVNTLQALQDLHKRTVEHFDFVNGEHGIKPPFPPIILIIDDARSPLLDTNYVHRETNIPIFDVWPTTLEYECKFITNFGFGATQLSAGNWKNFLQRLTMAYLPLAVARNIIGQEIVTAQTEFYLCAENSVLCDDVSSLIANNLFSQNIYHAIKQPAMIATGENTDKMQIDTEQENKVSYSYETAAKR